MDRDYTHLPTRFEQSEGNSETDVRSYPPNYHQNNVDSNVAKIDSTKAAKDEHNSETQPTPPEAMMKVWKFITDETNHRALIFIGTLTIALIYSGQLAQMIESNRISRKSLEDVQRAFVSPRKVEITPITANNPKQAVAVQIDFGWENNGTTPARALTQHMSTRWDAKPIPDDFVFQDEWLPGDERSIRATYISPKGSLGGGKFLVPSATLLQIYSGTLHVYYWGWAKYTDAFQQRHVTESCFELRSNGTAFDLKNGFPFHLDECARHNCVDDDCVVER